MDDQPKTSQFLPEDLQEVCPQGLSPRAHSAMTVKALPHESQSAGLRYPPHSSDLALADFFPFPKVQTAIK
jgi:hypothetical protein